MNRESPWVVPSPIPPLYRNLPQWEGSGEAGGLMVSKEAGWSAGAQHSEVGHSEEPGDCPGKDPWGLV